MTPAELRTILSRLGLSQVRAAQCLGVHKATIQRWVKGEREIPGPAIKILELLMAGKITADELAGL